MSARQTIYAVLFVLGAIVPMYWNFQYLHAGASVPKLLLDFFTVPLESAVTASLLFDLLTAFAAFNVLLLTEGRELATRDLVICLAVSWLVAFAAGLPLYLFLRERRMRAT